MAEGMVREKIEMLKERVSSVRARLPFMGERRILSEEGEEGILVSFRSRVEERLGGIPALSEFLGKEEEEGVKEEGEGAETKRVRRTGDALVTGASAGPELDIMMDERVAKTPGLIH